MHARAQEEEAAEEEKGGEMQKANTAYRDSAWRRELHGGFPALKLSRLAAELGGLGLLCISRHSASLALTASNDRYCSHLRSTTTRNHTPSKPRACGV
jgi:hypothetical protein